ncbi:ABC transporter substrate-binding protein [Leucobacter salsicius]|uniref:ABC transporter substrate-binding protein n=1 Tax=Leucobacter salsicius TaxID=664638 RepID=UPI00034CEC5F|nr:ABC transporter substrate-binding protein [Leucobacter salsicius]
MKIRYALPAMAAAALLTLTGCTNTDGATPTDKPADSGTSTVKVDDAAVALLPAEVKDSGELRIGTDAEYPPNEYKDADGNPIGWGVELATAVSEKLGLAPKWEIMGFDSIIPRIQENGLDMGSSSFTDTKERQASVDFVNFLNAGSQWAAPVGSDVDPNNACGLTIAVQATTVQDTEEMPARSKECTDAGKEPIEVLRFDGQPEVTQSVIDGRAAAFSADSPVTGDAVAKLGDKLELVGELFDAAPYGFATQKDSDMTKAVQAALQSLMDDGTYVEILKKAGIESGALTTATINAGEN